MQMVILLTLVVTLSMAQYRFVQAPSWALFLAAAAFVIIAGVLARLTSISILVATGDSRRKMLLTLATHLWLVLGSAAMMAVGLGTAITHALAWPIVDYFLLLTPLILALLAIWTQEYPGYLHTRRLNQVRNAAAGPGPLSLGRYVTYNLRHQLLFILAPAAIIMIGNGLLSSGLTNWLGSGPRTDLAILLGMLLVAGVVFIVAPLMIVHIWRTAPLPQGHLRDQLMHISAGMGLRYRHILVWQTGGTIINAGVMGLIAPLRYVLLTDALLEQMQPAEVQAIFAHEAGHVVSHHILYSGIFAAGTILMSICAEGWLAQLTHWPDEVLQAIVLISLVAAWWLGFGYISRRFERQSDVIAAWIMGQVSVMQEDPPDSRPGQISTVGAAAFARSLQRVAELNGMSYDRPNWRHGSISWRVQYILGLGSSLGTRADIDRIVRRIKIFCWLLLIVAAAAVVVQSL